MENKATPSRLRNRADFEHLKKFGFRVSVSSWLFASYCKNKDLGLRVGWTVPGYVGTAVVRNRLKRWMREDFKKNQTLNDEKSPLSLDINLVFKRKGESFYRELQHRDLTSALEELFQQLKKKRRSN